MSPTTQANPISIAFAPQTIGGTIVSISAGRGKADVVSTIPINATSRLATLTGATTVMVYTNGRVQEINKSALAGGDNARFNGFLFKINGSLVLFAGFAGKRPWPCHRHELI